MQCNVCISQCDMHTRISCLFVCMDVCKVVVRSAFVLNKLASSEHLRISHPFSSKVNPFDFVYHFATERARVTYKSPCTRLTSTDVIAWSH